MRKIAILTLSSLLLFSKIEAAVSDYLPFWGGEEPKKSAHGEGSPVAHSNESVDEELAEEEEFDPDPERDYPIVYKLIEEENYEEAIKLVRYYDSIILNQTEQGKRWLELYVRLAVEVKDAGSLMQLYDLSPIALEGHEEALLLVARAYIFTKQSDSYEELRQSVEKYINQPDQWFLLDSDQLVLKGKNEDAIKHLESKELEGEVEVERLLRLSIIQLNGNASDAWKNINKACDINPKHIGARSLRARVLEAIGKKDLAQSEYISVAYVDPKNIGLRDQLGEFFKRHKDYPAAIQTWGATLKDNATDRIWVKTYFWSKVTHPIKFAWASEEIPEGDSQLLMQYLASLKPDVYWNEEAIKQDPRLSTYLRTEQATFWLRLIQLLKDGNEEKALELVELNPFEGQEWDRDLFVAIKRILHYRSSSTFGPREEYYSTEESHTFFKELDQAVSAGGEANVKMHLSTEVKDLLMSDEAFAAAFLGAKWIEVALYLHQMPIIPSRYPKWLAYGITQSYRYNRGYLEALNFASKQESFDTLNVLKGELLVATGSPDAAIEELKPYAEDDTPVGFKSAWLVSNIYVGQKKLEEARSIISGHKQLAQSIQGQETMAKIELLEGNNEAAEKIYLKIIDQSSEAKIYYSKIAYQKGNWAEAKKLTIELLRVHPNNLVLRQNLLKIMEQEKQSNE